MAAMAPPSRRTGRGEAGAAVNHAVGGGAQALGPDVLAAEDGQEQREGRVVVGAPHLLRPAPEPSRPRRRPR
jgi:hypothetical protein